MLLKTIVLSALATSVLASAHKRHEHVHRHPIGSNEVVAKIEERNNTPQEDIVDANVYKRQGYPHTTLATVTTSNVAAPTATPSYAPAAAAPASGGKRGLAYNDPSLTNIFSGQGMSWAFNWGNSAGGTIAAGLEFVPMCWGLKTISGWSSNAAASIAAGSKHLLSFNEPDLPSQSNMSPSDAANYHIQYMNPFGGQAQIGSPAITNAGGEGVGLSWLGSFFQACGGQCKVDFIAFHWYNNPGTIQDFEQHVSDVISFAAQYGISKVWLTEFGLNYGSDSDVTEFLGQALPFLDSQPAVERYAYFMCGEGTNQLVSGGGASAAGSAYVSA